MNEGNEPASNLNHDDQMMAAHFANLIMQQANMALLMMGRLPHPETGETMRDLQSAKFFIDQIEMLEFKTRGNLDKNEESLLKQNLMTVRMAFVEAVKQAPAENKSEAKPVEGNEPVSAAPNNPSATESSEESRKRFSKKYE